MARYGRRRRWPAYLVGIVVLAGLAFAGYWYATLSLFQAAVARATSAPVAGASIACADSLWSGPGLVVDFRCQKASVADARQRYAAALPGVWASAPLLRPGYVNATLDSPLTLNVQPLGLALTASWASASTAATAWLDGLTGGSADVTRLRVESGGSNAAAFGVSAASAEHASTALAAAGQGSYRVSVDADNVGISRTDGTALPELDLNGDALAVGVGPLGTDPAAAVLRWLRAGGTLKVENLRLAMAGAIVTASGELTLSREGRLNGSLLLAYNSIQNLGNLVEVFRPGSREKYAPALQALNAFTRAVNGPDGQLRQTSLTFTEGAIWLAILPLPIDPIPPLRF
jgi:hypothetical protein